MPLHKIDNTLPQELVFYCKDCKKIVETNALGRKFAYRCQVCQTKNVAFGSLKSIKNFYRIKEGEMPPILSEEQKKALKADKL